MRRHRWQILLGVGLILGSAALYVVHYLLFRNVHHILIYLVGDIAFVGIEVFLVTMVVHQLLTLREKRQRLKKLNMVIGSFFSEVGTRLLAWFSDRDRQLDELRRRLGAHADWQDRGSASRLAIVRGLRYELEIDRAGFADLKAFLVARRDFMLRLLENPNLLEHESFTDLLRATFHLVEELERRPGFEDLPDTDIAHLHGDARRTYARLVLEWLEYMKHLKANYPYLFSLAARTNPFDTQASTIVR